MLQHSRLSTHSAAWRQVAAVTIGLLAGALRRRGGAVRLGQQAEHREYLVLEIEEEARMDQHVFMV